MNKVCSLKNVTLQRALWDYIVKEVRNECVCVCIGLIF
jgi:hypothetical protein